MYLKLPHCQTTLLLQLHRHSLPVGKALLCLLQQHPQTGTFSVRAEMPNPEHILLPGQFTKVRLLLDVREAAVVVPNKAIAIEKGGAYIFVVRADSIVERRMVELGPEVGNNVIIERGLVPHENIVVEGFHKLTHGDKVIPSTYRAEQEDHSKN